MGFLRAYPSPTLAAAATSLQVASNIKDKTLFFLTDHMKPVIQLPPHGAGVVLLNFFPFHWTKTKRKPGLFLSHVWNGCLCLKGCVFELLDFKSSSSVHHQPTLLSGIRHSKNTAEAWPLYFYFFWNFWNYNIHKPLLALALLLILSVASHLHDHSFIPPSWLLQYSQISC